MDNISALSTLHGIAIDTLCHALNIPRASFYRHVKQRVVDTPIIKPKNALSNDEKQTVLNLLHSEYFIDKTPYEIFSQCLDNGKYYCSIRTMYRLLEKQNENHDRRNQRKHHDAVKPELMATAPNQVWSWDITKLLGPKKWQYFYLYVIIDIFSRYVVGWLVAERESKSLARRLIHESCLKQQIKPHQLTLHADRGPSMTSHTVTQLLAHLCVTKSHNRPYNSNDNPFSESQFKTLKYCPDYPGRFYSLKDAEIFNQPFFKWYNHEHHHSGIAWLTPYSVHYGLAKQILDKRHQTMLLAFYKNPERFNNKTPKLIQLPEAVYINPPQTIHLQNPTQEAAIVA